MSSKNKKKEKILIYLIIILAFLVITLVVLIILENLNNVNEEIKVEKIKIDMNFTKICYNIILEGDIIKNREIRYNNYLEENKYLIILMM